MAGGMTVAAVEEGAGRGGARVVAGLNEAGAEVGVEQTQPHR